MNHLPYLCIQGDWNEALCEPDGQAWVTCKLSGNPGYHGDLQTVGLSSDGNPYVTASEGFNVISVDKMKIYLSHHDPNCQCVFYGPKSSFKNIHLKSITCFDVTLGGLGVSTGADNKLLVWDTELGLIRRELVGHVGDIYTCRFFPSGIVVLSAGADMQLKIWSAETGQCPVTMTGHTAAIMDTAIVDRGRNVISVSRDGTAMLWDCGESKVLATLIKIDDAINSCALGLTLAEDSKNFPTQVKNEREVGTEGKLLLIGCENGQIQGFSIGSRKQVFLYPCVTPVNAVNFVDTFQIACGCQDGQVLLFDLRNMNSAISSWVHAESPVTSLSPFKDGFLVSKLDGSCTFYSNKSEKFWQLTGSDCDPVYKIASVGNNLFTCCRDGVIRKYEIWL